jgi:hypothetical protein
MIRRPRSPRRPHRSHGSFGTVMALALAGMVVLSGCEVPPEASAQGATGQARAASPAPGAAGADTVQLVFEREVFSYPAFDRRNPFAPVTGDLDGPRFEDLELQMVILVEDGPGSVATLGIRGSGGQRAAGGRTFRVREGDVLGNMRIRTIRLREIVMEVDEFGQRETRVLELRRQEPEATGSDTIPDPPPPGPEPGGTDAAPPVTPPDTTATPAGNWNGGSA